VDHGGDQFSTQGKTGRLYKTPKIKLQRY
jgi:hypothetical protein